MSSNEKGIALIWLRLHLLCLIFWLPQSGCQKAAGLPSPCICTRYGRYTTNQDNDIEDIGTSIKHERQRHPWLSLATSTPVLCRRSPLRGVSDFSPRIENVFCVFFLLELMVRLGSTLSWAVLQKDSTELGLTMASSTLDDCFVSSFVGSPSSLKKFRGKYNLFPSLLTAWKVHTLLFSMP